jgi:hypothetical protein
MSAGGARGLFEFRRINRETLPQFPRRLSHDDDMKHIARYAMKVERPLFVMAQTAFNSTTSILVDARVPRKLLTMLA